MEFHVFYVNMWITDPEVDSRLSGHVLRPPVSDSHLYGVRCSPLEYQTTDFPGRFLQEFFTYSALSGSTVGTCRCQSMRPGFAGDIAPRAVLSSLDWLAHDARHHGRYGPDVTVVACFVVCNDRCNVALLTWRSSSHGGGRRCVAFSCRQVPAVGLDSCDEG